MTFTSVPVDLPIRDVSETLDVVMGPISRTKIVPGFTRVPYEDIILSQSSARSTVLHQEF